ncbi:MAG TPA: cytochrome c3 family protein [Blastocatellia bacterium]|nr:cytochrome c3 family protein [Blastocatellia bacterium]
MRRLISFTLLGLFAALFLRLTFAQEDTPKPIPQPIPFSHKLHGESGVQCARCHTTAASKDQAGIPTAKDCITCHQNFQKDSATLKTLAEYEQKPIPWVRIYKLPSFVFFSHKSHLNAKATCATCHGEVQTRQVLGKEKPTSMASCIDCHRERKASTECNYCHELNR